VGKELESSGFVWLNTGDIQNNCGEAGHLRIARLRHPFKVGHVLFGNVRLLKQKKTLCDLIRELREEGQ
jgi:hypothetical protein